MRRIRIFFRRMFHSPYDLRRWDWYESAWQHRFAVYLKWRKRMSGGYPTSPLPEITWKQFRENIWPDFEKSEGDKS